MKLSRLCLYILFSVLATAALNPVAAQQGIHPQSASYEWPADSQVRAKLDHWQDQKFGIILHWGLYSVPGIMESWNLCSEDWITRDSSLSYDEYKKWYWGQRALFNPVNFNPDEWAEAAKLAGMRYVVFTTKHHDGFNMFDTKQTDFKISAGPFASNPKADVAKFVFESFRRKGFMIGAYFSKPDWHSENYWWPAYATADRNNNYDIRKFPWRWKKFRDFTFNQISELLHNYGKVDLLWLDGGWVRPKETVNEEVLSWGARIPDWSQDIDMPRIASMGRTAQPGLLIVDRTVHGPYENYQTPEQRIPDKQLMNPWESCMTLATNWGYVPGDTYKSPEKVIHSLIEVVAKGGSLLLGVGPKPDGTLPVEATTRMAVIGQWLRKNGASIYGTRIVDDYHQGPVWFTQKKDSSVRYAIVSIDPDSTLTREITWRTHLPKKGSKMILLETGQVVKWKEQSGTVTVTVPESILKTPAAFAALAFSFTPAL